MGLLFLKSLIGLKRISMQLINRLLLGLLICLMLACAEPVDYTQTVYFDTVAHSDNPTQSHPWFELAPNDPQCTYEKGGDVVTCYRPVGYTEVFYIADGEIWTVNILNELHKYDIIAESNNMFRSTP